jgi:hypothetical protein
MAQLRSDILYKRKCEDVEISERQFKRIHIAEPIQEYQIDDKEKLTFNAFNISDTEESDDDANDPFENVNNSNPSIINSEQWTRIIENWIEMINVEDNSENFIGGSDEIPYDFEVGGHDTHPADNKLAKWKLLDLFDNSLEAPVCIGSMINLNLN